MSTTAGVLGPVTVDAGGRYFATLSAVATGAAVVTGAIDGRPMPLGARVRFAVTSWVQRAPLPAPRQVLAVAMDNRILGVMYPVRGACYDGIFAVVEAYTPS